MTTNLSLSKLNQLAKEASKGYATDIIIANLNEVTLWELEVVDSISYSELLRAKEDIRELMSDIQFFDDKTIKSFINLITEINRLLEELKKMGDCKTHQDLTNELLSLF